MRYFLIVAGSTQVGGYSAFGLHRYSTPQSRIKSVWTRHAVFIVAVMLFIFLPMIGGMFLLAADSLPSALLGRVAWFLVVFFAWIGPV